MSLTERLKALTSNEKNDGEKEKNRRTTQELKKYYTNIEYRDYRTAEQKYKNQWLSVAKLANGDRVKMWLVLKWLEILPL